MKKIIYLISLLVLSMQGAWSQSNWQFVGPKSTNQQPDNGFETSQMNNITIDPYNPLHMFASSWWGGLWESTNRGANWFPVEVSTMNCSGVSAVTFLSSSEILIGDSYQPSRFGANNEVFRMYSKAVWKYNFQTTNPSLKWTSLGTLTNTSSIPFCIKSIAVYPNNASILFVCTTNGLYRSTNAGATWSIIPTADDWVENMIFVPYGSPVNYYCYIAGSLGHGMNSGSDLMPTGLLMLKESNNAGGASPTFTNLSTNLTTTESRAISKICRAPVDGSGNVQFFMYTLGFHSGWGDAYIHTFKKNINTGTLSAYARLNASGSISHGGMTRVAVAYDNVNKGVWFGGIKLAFFHVPTSTLSSAVLPYYHTNGGKIHDDMHDIQILTYNSQLEIYVAHDAGIARSIIGLFSGSTPPSSPDAAKLYFNPLNNGIHVSLIRGFSGTEDDPNIYAIGGHDIVNSDIFDAATGKNRYTRETWENDGTLIDKFDKNRMFLDASVWNALYHVSTDGGQTIGSAKSFYRPAAGNVFAQGTQEGEIGGGGFSYRQFYQDPYRPNRIFHAKSHIGISQYDLVSKTFVLKIEPWTIQPNLDWTCYSGDWKIKSWDVVKGMSFSPQSPNSFYFIINGDGNDFNCPANPAVIKYIGNNLDDCWNNHNIATYTDGSGTHPQWQNITPVWQNFGVTSIDDQRGIDFIEIETSPWNKDVIYVMLNVPHHPEISVMKYDGITWSNYSTGLPPQELGSSMVMDHQSNDGIYLSTNLHVYYREANPASQWTIFKTGMPFIPAVQMEVNYKENTVRAGTFGRGIWKTDLKCPDLSIMAFNNTTPVPGFNQAMVITATNVTLAPGKLTFRAANSITLNPKFVGDASNGAVFLGYIHGCTDPGNSFVGKSNNLIDLIQGEDEEEKEEQERIEENSIQASPNPSHGLLTLTFLDDAIKNVIIHDMMGKVVFKDENVKGNTLKVDITNQPAGIYLIKVISGEDVISKKIIVQ